MDSSFVQAIPIEQTKHDKSLHSWSKFVYKRKLIKNLLLIIKDNIHSYCKSIQISFDNLVVVLSKVFSSLDISQLQIFMDIAQIVCRFGTASPFTPCIQDSAALFRSFDSDYILKVFWMSFRFSGFTDCDNFKVVKICTSQRVCINPFHCSLMKDFICINPRPKFSNNKSNILKSIYCNFQIEGHNFPTKVFAPSLLSLSSVFVIYYNPSQHIDNNRALWQELGICFYQMDNMFVLLYNFSPSVIFVSSICMELNNLSVNRNQHDFYVPVHRILPNQSITVFSIDNLESLKRCPLSIPVLNSGIITVQISFGKGWGKGYSRSSFIYCPRRCEASLKLPNCGD